MPTLFQVVEAMLMPPIRRKQAATQASTTTVHLGSKRAVSELPARIQVMSAHGDSGELPNQGWVQALEYLCTYYFFNICCENEFICS